MDPVRSGPQNRDKERRVPVHTAAPKPAAEPVEEGAKPATAGESAEGWRDRALRLQAEMENYRKRQQRLAEERIVEERERLLRRFLGVADELEQALIAQRADVHSLRQGVELTYRTLMQHLDQEGARVIDPEGEPFDPEWHEAVGTTTGYGAGVPPHTVVEVLRPGYRVGDRLLRPARVLISA